MFSRKMEMKWSERHEYLMRPDLEMTGYVAHTWPFLESYLVHVNIDTYQHSPESASATWDSVLLWPSSVAAKLLSQQPMYGGGNPVIPNSHTQPIKINVYYYRTDSSLNLVRSTCNVSLLSLFLRSKAVSSLHRQSEAIPPWVPVHLVYTSFIALVTCL